MQYNSKEYDVFIANIELPKDLSYYCATIGCQDTKQKVATLNYIARKILQMSIRVLPVLIEDALFLLMKKEDRDFVRIKLLENFSNLRLQNHDTDSHFQAVPRSLLEQALRYFIWLQLYPLWYRIKDNLFIYAPLSRNIEVRPCVELRLNLLDEDRVYFTLKSNAVRFRELTLEDLLGTRESHPKNWEIFESNLPVTADDLVESTCVVLPHLTPGRIACLRKQPTSTRSSLLTGFCSKKEFIQYWRDMYQIQIPVDTSEEAYLSIQLGASQSQLFTYPLFCCWHSFGLIESKSRTEFARKHITQLMLSSLSQLRFDFTSTKLSTKIQAPLFKFEGTLYSKSISDMLNTVEWKSSTHLLKENRSLHSTTHDKKDLNSNNNNNLTDDPQPDLSFSIDITELKQILNPPISIATTSDICTEPNATTQPSQSVTICQSTSNLKPKGTRLGVKPYKSLLKNQGDVSCHISSNLSSSLSKLSKRKFDSSELEHPRQDLSKSKKLKFESNSSKQTTLSQEQLPHSMKPHYNPGLDKNTEHMLSSENLNRLSVAQLKALLKQHKLSVCGKKQDLINRAIAFFEHHSTKK